MAQKFLDQDNDFPFGPGPGAINGMNEEYLVSTIRDVLDSPARAVWGGSFTWNQDEGNEPSWGRVYYHNALTGQTVNSFGLPNIGRRRALAVWPDLCRYAQDAGKALIPSVSAGKGDNAMQVLPRMAYDFAEAGASAVEVNYSCPNKITEGGGREPTLGNDPEAMFEVDQAVLKAVGNHITLIRKLPAYIGINRHKIVPVAEYFAGQTKSTMLHLSNAIEGQQILTELGDPALQVPGNVGALSGPATVEIGRDQLWQFRLRLPLAIGLISCNGVSTASEVRRRIDMGADMTSGVTIFMQNEHAGISYGRTALILAQEYAYLSSDNS